MFSHEGLSKPLALNTICEGESNNYNNAPKHAGVDLEIQRHLATQKLFFYCYMKECTEDCYSEPK